MQMKHRSISWIILRITSNIVTKMGQLHQRDIGGGGEGVFLFQIKAT